MRTFYIWRTTCTYALVKSNQPSPDIATSKVKHSAELHVHYSYLALMVMFHFPTSRQLQLFVSKHVEEAHQITIVLVALKMVGVPPDFGDHVLQTRVICKHAVGTLKNK